VFEEYGVDLVGSGHDHALKRTTPIRNAAPDPEGIIYIGDGGLGVSNREVAGDRWYLRAGGMAASIDNVHLIRYRQTRIDVQAVGRDGEILDDFFIPHDRSARARHFRRIIEGAAVAEEAGRVGQR
jgi:acid phosphatase type 7